MGGYPDASGQPDVPEWIPPIDASPSPRASTPVCWRRIGWRPPTISRQTIRNGAIGAVVGSVLGFVPVVLLVAPVIGGGVVGYLERDGAKRGAVAGGVAGLLIAALTTVITGTITFVRFGDLPFASPLSVSTIRPDRRV